MEGLRADLISDPRTSSILPLSDNTAKDLRGLRVGLKANQVVMVVDMLIFCRGRTRVGGAHRWNSSARRSLCGSRCWRSPGCGRSRPRARLPRGCAMKGEGGGGLRALWTRSLRRGRDPALEDEHVRVIVAHLARLPYGRLLHSGPCIALQAGWDLRFCCLRPFHAEIHVCGIKVAHLSDQTCRAGSRPICVKCLGCGLGLSADGEVAG